MQTDTLPKLGFTLEAAKKLKLDPTKSLGIAINEDDENDQNFYVVAFDEKQPHSIGVLKAGEYYYVNTKDLFDSLNIDYTNNFISFEIIEEEVDNQKIFKFKRTEKKRNSNKS